MQRTLVEAAKAGDHDAFEVLVTAGADRWGEPEPPPAKRKLTRIKEGQEIAGVCTGIAAYTEIRIDWVRTVFVLATIFSGGLFLILYIALAVLLPVMPTAPVRR